VVSVEKARSRISAVVKELASAGIPPWVAQVPSAMMILHF